MLNREVQNLSDPATPEFAALERGLGKFGLRWLIACAAFPVLRLPITLHLGAALKWADGAGPPTEEETLALAALQWFRQGWMPTHWRIALLARQTAADRAATRTALAELAYAMLDANQDDAFGRVIVTRVRPAPSDFAYDWGAWRADLPSSLAEHDEIFDAFVSCGAGPSRRWLLALACGFVLGAIAWGIGLLSQS
jgi:hypothetical protein